MYDRKPIYTDEVNIDGGNVLSVLNESLMVHSKNRTGIQTLWDVYRGKTDIRNKQKLTRPEINNRICENRAYEVVSFWTGYVFGAPLQYVHQSKCNESSDADIVTLNGAMEACSKDAIDSEIAEWMYVRGQGYRYTKPGNEDGTLAMRSLDPRRTFAVRSSDVWHRPIMAVVAAEKKDGTAVFTCYTETDVFVIAGTMLCGALSPDAIIDSCRNGLGGIPIVEYTTNQARLGSFEVALDLLDALNKLDSNRMDDVESVVNAIMVLLGCGIGEWQKGRAWYESEADEMPVVSQDADASTDPGWFDRDKMSEVSGENTD